MPTINWKRFPRIYSKSDAHWYVSKAKTYTLESFEQLRSGLKLLDKWFVQPSELLNGREIKFLKNYLKSDQESLFGDTDQIQIRWDPKTELFFAYNLDKNAIISAKNREPKTLKLYSGIFKDIEKGATYSELLKKSRQKLLNDIAANARNFLSMYKKLGFAWVQEGRLVSITSTGEKFMSGDPDLRVIIEKQLLKWQLYNPTLPGKYSSLQIFPYIFLLKLVLKLNPAEISKREYALFVTKAKSMAEIENVVTQINEFRQLDQKQMDRICESLMRNDSSRTRPVYEELLDSASKEIGFFTLAGPLKGKLIDRAEGIALADRDRANELLAKTDNPVFIEFRNELDWFSYYGDWQKGPTVEDAIEYYADIGEIEKAKAVSESPQASKEDRDRIKFVIKEKDIELWFLERLQTIEKGLSLYRDGKLTGHQYSTEIGTVDILAIDESGTYVVLEFKRDQSSDQTVGQLLRYIGWVHINLAAQRPVRGIIIASEVDDKTKYALLGIQHPKKEKMFSAYEHISIRKVEIK